MQKRNCLTKALIDTSTVLLTLSGDRWPGWWILGKITMITGSNPLSMCWPYVRINRRYDRLITQQVLVNED